jgi:S-adenosylmethionine-diacylglycerol 3-amino-3-carboxypropyl transferase
MLARDPARVIAFDLSPAQLACLELRVAAFRSLSHPELLELIGSVPSSRRQALYRLCRPLLSREAQCFWDARPASVTGGIGAAGKFEHYFSLFRRFALPLIHSRPLVEELLRPKSIEERQEFYERRWDTWRWKLLFRVFFSRSLMGRMGRDPRFFKYVEGPVATRILQRTRHALTVLDPSQNSYVNWILRGCHTSALPFAFRPENFENIRRNLDRLEWRCQALEEFLDGAGAHSIGAFNLSDIFEYMPVERCHHVLERLARTGRPGARLAYWNMLVPRSRPACLAGSLASRDELARSLAAQD